MAPGEVHTTSVFRSVAVLGWVLGLAMLFGCSSVSGLANAQPANAQPLDGGPDYPLFDHSITWTGDRLVIVGGAGGDMNDGLLVDDPLAWTPQEGFTSIAKPGGPVRNRQAAVWTGDEVLIWAGTSEPFGVGNGLLTSTAAYDPASGQWRELAPSPDELAKVGADAGLLGRTVLFAGGSAPQADRDRLVARYDLDLNRWSMTPLPGTAIALAADGERAFVLSQAEALDDEADQPGVRLWQLQIADEGLSTEAIGLPAEVETHGGQIGLALVGRTLALLADGDEDDAVLYVAEIDATGSLGAWRETELDNVDLPPASLTRKITINVVGRQVAVNNSSELHWIDVDQGTTVSQTLTSVESCVLSNGAPTAVADGLVAIGGNCISVDTDGEESDLYGSYLFLPPTG